MAGLRHLGHPPLLSHVRWQGPGQRWSGRDLAWHSPCGRLTMQGPAPPPRAVFWVLENHTFNSDSGRITAALEDVTPVPSPSVPWASPQCKHTDTNMNVVRALAGPPTPGPSHQLPSGSFLHVHSSWAGPGQSQDLEVSQMVAEV